MAITFSTPGSTFVVDVTAGASGTSQINVTAGGLMNLTAAGIIAMLNEVYTYYNTSSKLVTLMKVADRGITDVEVSVSGASYTVLNADINTEVANLQTILQTAANIAA